MFFQPFRRVVHGQLIEQPGLDNVILGHPCICGEARGQRRIEAALHMFSKSSSVFRVSLASTDADAAAAAHKFSWGIRARGSS